MNCLIDNIFFMYRNEIRKCDNFENPKIQVKNPQGNEFLQYYSKFIEGIKKLREVLKSD